MCTSKSIILRRNNVLHKMCVVCTTVFKTADFFDVKHEGWEGGAEFIIFIRSLGDLGDFFDIGSLGANRKSIRLVKGHKY